MYLTASPTVRIVSAASSGISTPNSSSKRHDQFDRIKAVRAKVIDEAGAFGDFVGVNAKMLDHDLFHALAGIAHKETLVFLVCSSSLATRLPLIKVK